MSTSGQVHKRQTKQLLNENILTVREMTTYLKLPETAICKLAAFGELPGLMIGGSWCFDRRELLELIAAAKTRVETQPDRETGYCEY
jgi:excisionase family DNA binding protein